MEKYSYKKVNSAFFEVYKGGAIVGEISQGGDGQGWTLFVHLNSELSARVFSESELIELSRKLKELNTPHAP
jgi:hypothetical protein